MSIIRWIEFWRRFDPELTPEEMAEVLWLATQIDVASEAATDDGANLGQIPMSAPAGNLTEARALSSRPQTTERAQPAAVMISPIRLW